MLVPGQVNNAIDLALDLCLQVLIGDRVSAFPPARLAFQVEDLSRRIPGFRALEQGVVVAEIGRRKKRAALNVVLGERTVEALQKRLRCTWERAVEEAVGPVIKRLSNKVETKGLAKVTTLTIDDCTKMRQACGRCSTLLHSSADALNPLAEARDRAKRDNRAAELGDGH